MNSHLEKMETCLEKREAMDLEANPKEKGTVANYSEVLKEDAAVGSTSGLRASSAAEEADPERWWILAEVGLCLRTVASPCHPAPRKGYGCGDL
jgi:hypothetical protein